MEMIYTWIRNIVIYMILNTIIMNLVGNKNYRKYISIVSGMILVLIVVAPIINYMKLEDKLTFFLEENDFALETSDFKTDLNRMEKTRQDTIFSAYKDKLRASVEDLLSEEDLTLEDFDIELNQDTQSAGFGEIICMNITARVENSNQKEDRKRLSIDEIEIKDISFGEKEEAEQKEPPSPMEIALKKRLSDFYNIEQDNINISIQGGQYG